MKLLLPIFIFLTSVICSHGQTKRSLSTGELAKLDLISTQDVPKSAPGIASGIVINGKIAYIKCAGYANLEDSTQIDTHSRFNIASNGKQFTALAILILSEQKKLSVKDDIRTFYPKLYPEIKEAITVEHLLSHTSGIRDVYDLWALQGITWWKQTLDNNDVLTLLHQQHELNFAPGTKYAYSNSNYILLALLVEKVSGQSFVSFTNEMFQKLDMPGTSFESNYQKIRGPVASPYFNFNTWTNYKWICNIHGDGNLFSTLEDQLHWEKILQTKKSRFLSKKLIEQSQQLTPNHYTEQYGYGLEFGSYNNVAYKFHEGATGAWKATTVRFPDKNISIITLTNSGKTIPYMQTRQLADVVLKLENQAKTFKVKPDSSGVFLSIDDVEGVFQNEDNFTFILEKRDTSLFLLRSGRNDIRLEREAPNIFHQWNDPDFKQEFTRNEKGELEVTAYYTSHAPYTLTRPLADWSGFNYACLNGQYKNDETNVSFELQYQSKNTYELTIGYQKQIIKLITPDKLMFNNYSVEIIKNTTGNVRDLLLSGDRIKKVRFTIQP